MAELLISPYVEDTVSIETPGDMAIDFSLEEIAVERLNELNGKSISESKIRKDYGLLIVGIINGLGEAVLNPGSDYILSKKDKIMVIGSQDNLNIFNKNIIK